MKIVAGNRYATVDKSRDDILEIMHGALNAMFDDKLIVGDLLSNLGMDDVIKRSDFNSKIYSLDWELSFDDDENSDETYMIHVYWKALL